MPPPHSDKVFPPTADKALARHPGQNGTGGERGEVQAGGCESRIEIVTDEWHRRPDGGFEIGEEPDDGIERPGGTAAVEMGSGTG